MNHEVVLIDRHGRRLPFNDVAERAIERAKRSLISEAPIWGLEGPYEFEVTRKP